MLSLYIGLFTDLFPSATDERIKESKLNLLLCGNVHNIKIHKEMMSKTIQGHQVWQYNSTYS